MLEKTASVTQKVDKRYQNKYDKLLNETRKQQKHWYISVDDFSRVEYTLQSSDEQKIRLVHCYKPDSYYFHNFSGFYTNAEYRALEKAILAIERIKAAQSKRNEIKNKSSSQGIKRKDSVLNDLQENTWNGRCKWTEIKDPKWFGAFRTVYRESQIVFIIIQNQGPASFSYYLKYVNTREYWKLKQREGEYLADLIKRQFRQATANITNLDSSKVEVVKKTAAQVHKEQVALIKARDEAIRQKKLQRMTLENDLTNVLMQKYKSEDRKDYFGIEFLASGSSIRELEHIRGAVLPADIYEFRRTTAEFLSKINRGGNQSPEVVDLYKELISEYVKQYSHGKSHLSSGDINKYTRKLSSLQVQKNNDMPAMKEQVAPEDSKELERQTGNKIQKRKVGTRDFVIRTSVLSCMYKQHSIVNVDAVIKIVDRKGTIAERIVPAGYCQQCQQFFILEDDFKNLSGSVEPLCSVIDEKSYRKNYNTKKYFDKLSEWPERSILRKCGYTVSQAAGLSTPERRKILANVIDHDVLSKIEIRSHIKKQIILHANQELAIDKWESDYDFVEGYNKGYYAKYGVVEVRR